jgi:urease accessory protein
MMLAHVFVGDGGPAAGLMHPLLGADHVTAMFSVGVLSARIGGRAIWTVPATFVLVMIVGGILGATIAPLPGIELGVATSVLVLGVALAAAGRAPVWSALVAAGFFGLFHGYAHGGEMPAVASPVLYALGFAVSTIGLHIIGVLSGLLALCRRHGATRLRGAGVVIGLAGVWFVAAALR